MISRPLQTRWHHRLVVRLAVLGCLAVLAAVGSTGLVLLDRAERDTLAARQVLERSEAERTAALLDERVRQALGALAQVAAQMPQGAADDPAAAEALLEQRPLLLTGFNSVFVASIQGHMHLIHDEQGFRRTHLNLADRQYFKQVQATGKPAVSEPVMGRVTGEPVVVFAVPIKANGQMVGVLAGSVRLRSHPMLAGMARRAAMANNISGETLIYVTDAQSNLVWHPDSAKAGLPVGAEPLLAGPMAAWKQAGSPVDPNARASDDPNHILAYAGLPAAGWLLWRLEDRADVLAPLVEARQQALKAGAALTLCLTGLLLALLWRLLAPLRQLRARAERLFEPGLAADQGWPLAVGEVGELGSVLKRVLVDKQASDERSARMTQQLRSVLEAAPLAILLTRNGVFELASPEACRVLGRTEEAFAGLPGRAVYASNQDYALLGPRVGLAFSRKETFVQEVEFLRGDGSTFWGRLSGRPVDWQVSAAGTIWTVTDISAERAEREGLLWSANHDALTGLANRLAMTRHLDTLLAHRQTSTPAALLMLDLDRFKPINDQHGHAAGDAMLRAVAQALTGCVRGGDLAVRLGGDEFAVLLPLCAADAARRVAESICQAVARLAVPWEGQSLGVGVSVGLAMLNPDLATAADWLAAADGACYAAKAAGRGTVRMAGAPEEAAALRLVVVNT